MRRFKEWLGTGDTQKEIGELDGGARKECVYDLEKIYKLLGRLLKKLENAN